jgi:uncharacterized protein
MTHTEPAALLLDDDTIARYLRDHADFFQRYPKLLSELSLPHESGAAVSLVERQLALLRERNIDLRKRLAQLMRAAEDNHQLFGKVRALTLSWLDAASVAALDGALGAGLLQDLDADFAACFFETAAPGAAASGSGDLVHLRRLAPGEDAPMSHLAQASGISCGMLRGDEMSALFGVTASSAGSAVLVLMSEPGVRGLLAIGSRDPKHFTPDMGTLFVRYIADVLARVLRGLAQGD